MWPLTSLFLRLFLIIFVLFERCQTNDSSLSVPFIPCDEGSINASCLIQNQNINSEEIFVKNVETKIKRDTKKEVSNLLNFQNSYDNFIRSTKNKFLAPETIHSPFNPPKAIEEISAIPIAYGDFNSDKYTDIFMLDNSTKSIHLLKGHACVDGKTVLTFFGSRQCLSIAQNFTCDLPRSIYNLVASDFTGSANQDLLVTVKSEEYPHDYRFDILLIKGNSTFEKFDCDDQIVLVKNALSEPFILDFNGDMISDFIVETEDCGLQLVLGGFENEDEYDDPKSNPNRYQCWSNLTSIEHLARPHASGFLNLNPFSTDLTPDIFVNGIKSFEYIFNDPGEGFNSKNTKKYNFPNVPLFGQSSFIDLNYDGQLDHIIPVCLDAEIFAECQDPDIMVLNTENGEWIPLLDTNHKRLGADFNHTLTFVEQNIYDLLIPVTLHIADINYDGFPDLITVLMDTETKRTFGAIFLNQADDTAVPNHFKRLFKLDWISEYDEDVLMISLFDIYNNGRLNLMMTTVNPVDQQFTLRAYDYYFEKSVYYSFLRINIISGLCSDKSETRKCPNHLAFGSAPPGVTVCFDGPFEGERSCSVQMAQSAHFALQPPYIIFGLGDTLNVVNNMDVSIANGNKNQLTHSWSDVIPGSKLVIIPYTPVVPDDWEMRVFINMSIYSLIALLFLMVLGLLLILAILILHFKEKVEDRADVKQYKNAWL